MSKVPDGPLNVNHWYDEDSTERDNRDWYWHTLHAIRSRIPMGMGLNRYLEEQYGIKILYDQNQHILPTYEIVDEQKHLIFLLKYK